MPETAHSPTWNRAVAEYQRVSSALARHVATDATPNDEDFYDTVTHALCTLVDDAEAEMIGIPASNTDQLLLKLRPLVQRMADGRELHDFYAPSLLADLDRLAPVQTV